MSQRLVEHQEQETEDDRENNVKEKLSGH